jgi:hypothetical protein
VLIAGGRCFITYFLLNPESEELMRSKRSSRKFIFPIDQGKSMKEHDPEAAVGLNESYIRGLYLKSGIRMVEPIHYGSWPGRKTAVGYQDIVVGVK